MSGARKSDGMSAEDLKRKMYSSLQSAGVLNDLRGYLRQSVINELRGRYQKGGEQPDDSGADLFIGSMKQNDNPSWEQKAMDNLVYQHLKQSRYLYTLSVFQQESGINGYEETLTEDLLHRLGASPDILSQKDKNKENEESFRAPNSSSTPLANSNEKKSLMWKILSRISSPLHMMTKDKISVKEEKEKGRQMSLAEKLQAIDEEMDGTLRQRRYDDIEQRKSIVSLTNMTRKAEEEAEKRARDSFEQWKKVELASMRVQEQEKAREKILETTRKLEDDFAERRAALINREKNAIERLNNQKDSMEKDLHHQRQTLLQELEHIQLREKSLQERERILKEMEMVKIRELNLIKAEALSEQLRSTGVKGHDKIRQDSLVSSCAESLRRSLTGKESQQLDEVLKEMQARAKESEMLRGELDVLKKGMETSKMHRPTDPMPPSNHHESARDLNDRSLRQRLDMVTRQLDEWSNQNKAQKEAVLHEEMDKWRREMMKLLEVKNQFEQKQEQLDDMIERVSSRVGSTARTPRKNARATSGQMSSTNLRLLMDPQYDVTKASIRDYEPIHAERNVRWADKMPYSVNTNLLGGGSKSPRSLYNATSNTTIDLDSSNDTTLSADLSTSGIRRDIREKFRSLEKETEQLDQMYKRYINANYKDSESKQTGKTMPSLSHSYDVTKQKYDVTKPVLTSNDVTAPKSHPPIIPDASETRLRSSVSVDGSGHESINREALSRQQEVVPPIKLQSSTTDYDLKPTDHETSSRQQEIVPPLKLHSPNVSTRLEHGVVLDTSPAKLSESEKLVTMEKPDDVHMALPSESSASFKSDSDRSSVSEPIVKSTLPTIGHQSLPKPKERSLPPLSPQQRTLPPIQTQKGKSPTLSVSELLIGSEKQGFAPKKSEDLGSSSDDSSRRYTGAGNSPPKSPFERPALLEKKKQELLSSKSMELEVESPIRNSSLDENKGFEEILQNIDLRSSRSIDGNMDPKLTDLLNKLEPVTSPTKTTQPDQSVVTSQSRSINHDRGVAASPTRSRDVDQGLVMSHKKINDPGVEVEDLNESSMQSSFSEKKATDNDHKGASKGDEYSDEFASSASEVKTMSDFERSSTSIPRIEEKVTGPESDDDRSGANINWSNFQPEKSGEHLPKEPSAKKPQDAQIVDFDKSSSDESLEAPSDGGKKRNSDDDFW